MKDQASCPAKLFFKKLVREGTIQEDPALPAMFGSAAHKAIENRLKFEHNPFETADRYMAKQIEEAGASEIDEDEFKAGRANMMTCLTNFETHLRDKYLSLITDPESQVELSIEIPFRKGILMGKIDLALPETWSDWKTGRIPTLFNLLSDPQSSLYHYLAVKSGNAPPKQFDYVYLQGQNVNMVTKTVQKGPNKGKAYAKADDSAPMLKFSFPVYTNVTKTNRMMQNYVLPLAKAIERGEPYKVISTMNCKSCKYRTACRDYDLPTVSEDDHQYLLDENKEPGIEA